MSDSLIEDRNSLGYTIRTDLMKEGQVVQCEDDKDMCIKKIHGEIILVKKSFTNNCFSK